MRTTRLYRLNVTLPEGSDEPGWEPDGWGDHPEHPTYVDPETGGREVIPFYWPRWTRPYLSRSGANVRANLLRKYGATVEVEASEPISWPSESAVPR